MKITKAQIQKMIKEELAALSEVDDYVQTGGRLGDESEMKGTRPKFGQYSPNTKARQRAATDYAARQNRMQTAAIAQRAAEKEKERLARLAADANLDMEKLINKYLPEGLTNSSLESIGQKAPAVDRQNMVDVIRQVNKAIGPQGSGAMRKNVAQQMYKKIVKTFEDFPAAFIHYLETLRLKLTKDRNEGGATYDGTSEHDDLDAAAVRFKGFFQKFKLALGKLYVMDNEYASKDDKGNPMPNIYAAKSENNRLGLTMRDPKGVPVATAYEKADGLIDRYAALYDKKLRSSPEFRADFYRGQDAGDYYLEEDLTLTSEELQEIIRQEYENVTKGN